MINESLVYIFLAVTFMKFTSYPLTSQQAVQAGWRQDAKCSGTGPERSTLACEVFILLCSCYTFLFHGYNVRFQNFPLLLLFVYDLVSFVVLWKPLPRKRQPKRMSRDFPSYPVLPTDMREIPAQNWMLDLSRLSTTI